LTLSDLQRLVVKEAYAAFFKRPNETQKQSARAVLQDPEAAATSVLIAAQHLLGPTFLTYEPETLWIELDICPINKDKLMAGIALAMTPSFYWDYRVFGATTHALNNEMVTPEAVPHCSPAQMAWAAFEAELLFALTDGESTRPQYDDPVAAYVAVNLFEEGRITPPVGLGFSAEELTSKVSPDSLNLKKETEDAWAALPKDALEKKKFENTPQGTQLQHLAATWVYVEAKTKVLRAELGKL